VRAGLRQRLSRSRQGRVGLGLLVALLAAALFADVLASDLPILLNLDGELYVMPAVTRPAALRDKDNQGLRRDLVRGRGQGWALFPLCEYGPEQQPKILRSPPASPDRVHWLGTDDRGRDVFARLVHGTRTSMLVGFCSVAIYLLIGVTLGLLAGYLRGGADFLISRLIELGLTFPAFFLILVIMALLERSSIWTVVLVLGLTGWTHVARLVRAEALRIRELDYITAARACGAGPARVMLRHVLPNAMGPVWVNAAFGVAGAMVAEAALSFLGFGTPPPTASWGELMGQGFEFPDRWWLVLCPGLLLFITVTALNLLGEALRDAGDPRQG
jgi:peptide/nickel transport system permease protein